MFLNARDSRGTAENQYWMFVIFEPSGGAALKNRHDSIVEATAQAQKHFQK